MLFFLRSEQKIEPSSQVINELLMQLKDRWELGDMEYRFHEKGFNCPELIYNSKNIDIEFLKCNPMYLECFLQNKTGIPANFISEYKGLEYSLDFHKDADQFVKFTNNDSVILNISIKNSKFKNFKVELKNTCRSVLLPQRKYSAGEIRKDFNWDNFGQSIYVDKFYVTNQDVYLWKKSQHINVESKPSTWHLPSTDLNLEQRRLYCNSIGMQLMHSHILDAASYLPSDYEITNPDYIYKFPYPWTKKKRGIFLHDSKDSRIELTKQDCKNAYVKECKEIIDFKHFSTDSVSWMGMNYVLGYFMEVVDNPIETNRNLKPSSFYFESKSSWHEIGKRAFWDGQGDKNANFDFGDEIPKEMNLKVAFRCMSYGEK